MRKTRLAIALSMFALFACKKEAPTEATYTGDRAYVRDDGEVILTFSNQDGIPTLLTIKGIVTVYKDAPDDEPIRVVYRVTVPSNVFGSVVREIDLHVHLRDAVRVREAVPGGRPGLVYYE